MYRSITAVATMALCLPIGSALAQDPDDDVQVVEVEVYRDLNGPFDPAEYPNQFTIGAGALGFVSNNLNPQDPSAVGWNARYGWHPVNLLTWEVGYTGATNEIVEPERTQGTVATFLESAVKVDLIPRSPVTPIVAAGVGYAAFTAGQQDFGNLTVPIAAGLEGKAAGLMLATRATWRPTFFDDLAFSDIGGDSWMWTADIGTRF